MSFDKENYWDNRLNQAVDGSLKPLRGQGDDSLVPKLIYPGLRPDHQRGLWVSTGPARMGIKAFKRKHTTSLTGRYNPKKRSIRGDVLRDLKVESWIELERRVVQGELQ